MVWKRARLVVSQVDLVESPATVDKSQDKGWHRGIVVQKDVFICFSKVLYDSWVLWWGEVLVVVDYSCW